MVQTTVRPVLTVLRTVRITMAAALASRPDVGSSCAPRGRGTHHISSSHLGLVRCLTPFGVNSCCTVQQAAL